MLSDKQTTGPSNAAATLADGLTALSRPQSLADVAYERLVAQLQAGHWTAGEKLPTEKRLTEMLAVSRPVLREALARLKADGRIESRQGAGAFVADRSRLTAFRMVTHAANTEANAVRPIQRSDAELAAWIGMLELRQIVEAGAAELAARRRTSEDLVVIQSALQTMEQALTEGADGAAADDAFHSAIARATQNAQIAHFVDYLGAQFSASRKSTWSAQAYGEGWVEIGHEEHRAIYKALVNADAAAAKRLAHRHVQRSIDRARSGGER